MNDDLHPNDSASQFGAGGNGGGGIAVAKKSSLLRGASIRHKMGVAMAGHKSHIRLAVQFINDSFQLRDMRLFEMNADQMRVDQLQGEHAVRQQHPACSSVPLHQAAQQEWHAAARRRPA